MLDPWSLALLACAPFVLRSGPKLRVWMALGLSATAGQIVPPLAVGWYIAIDFACAVAILLPRPVHCPARVIGGLSGLLILWHCGFIVGGKSDWRTYYEFQYVTGWLQLLCLAAWGSFDGRYLWLPAIARRLVRTSHRGEVGAP